MMLKIANWRCANMGLANISTDKTVNFQYQLYSVLQLMRPNQKNTDRRGKIWMLKWNLMIVCETESLAEFKQQNNGTITVQSFFKNKMCFSWKTTNFFCIFFNFFFFTNYPFEQNLCKNTIIQQIIKINTAIHSFTSFNCFFFSSSSSSSSSSLLLHFWFQFSSELHKRKQEGERINERMKAKVERK